MVCLFKVAKRRYRYIYGPVSSWRLGRSLGIDPVYTGRGKRCSFDCVYCQAGRTRALIDKRRIFVPTYKIIDEIKSLPPLKIDYITFSGNGEPTLAKNLGEIIKGTKRIRREKIAILTNSFLIHRKDVQKDIRLVDFVIAKLDAHSQRLFNRINRPPRTIRFKRILKGLKGFKSHFKGKFALQVMFVEENKDYAKEIAHLVRKIKPDEVQINTPLRPCPEKPLPKKEIEKIKGFFKGMKAISVYEAKKKKVKPIIKNTTLRRRGEL